MAAQFPPRVLFMAAQLCVRTTEDDAAENAAAIPNLRLMEQQLILASRFGLWGVAGSHKNLTFGICKNAHSLTTLLSLTIIVCHWLSLIIVDYHCSSLSDNLKKVSNSLSHSLTHSLTDNMKSRDASALKIKSAPSVI